MTSAIQESYHEQESIWILCDVQGDEGAEAVHRLRASFRESSELVAFGPDRRVLIVKPGGAQRSAA